MTSGIAAARLKKERTDWRRDPNRPFMLRSTCKSGWCEGSLAWSGGTSTVTYTFKVSLARRWSSTSTTP
ncbi:unnamed protein product, partial [Ectocarpus sp. 8 AP-2014]